QNSRISSCIGESVPRMTDIVARHRQRKSSPRSAFVTAAMTMRTPYRDIFLLACCQALLLVNNASLIAMNGLVGYALAGDKAFATAGVTTFVLGSALSAMPAALWMAKVGRRRGFMTGDLVCRLLLEKKKIEHAWS